MAYISGDLNCISTTVGTNRGGALFTYFSGDALATIIAAGYINDGGDKGLKVNDCVIVLGLTSKATKVTVVAANGDVTLV